MTFLDWMPCFSQLWPGFSFPRVALPFHDRFQHHYAKGSGALALDDLVSASSQNARDLRDDGTWARITGAIVAVHGELTEEAARIANRAAREHATRFLGELSVMLGKMDVL